MHLLYLNDPQYAAVLATSSCCKSSPHQQGLVTQITEKLICMFIFHNQAFHLKWDQHPPTKTANLFKDFHLHQLPNHEFLSYICPCHRPIINNATQNASEISLSVKCILCRRISRDNTKYTSRSNFLAQYYAQVDQLHNRGCKEKEEEKGKWSQILVSAISRSCNTARRHLASPADPCSRRSQKAQAFQSLQVMCGREF
jgi:hypothetical protein